MAEVNFIKLVDAAVNTYMSNVLAISANFLKGLTYPRSDIFKRVDCPNINAGIVNLPVFTGEMAEYVITQILPLESIYKKGLIDDKYQLAFDRTAKQELQQRFDTLTQSIKYYFKSCWKKEQESQEKKKPLIPVLTSEAAEKFLILQSNLRSYLKLQKDSVKTYEDMMKSLQELSLNNNLYITGSGFASSAEKLVKVLIWVISAYTDWFAIDIVEPSDIHAAVSVILPFNEVNAEIIGDIMKGEGLDKQQKEQFLNTLYRTFIGQNLYITEVALQKCANFVLGLKARHQDLLSKALNFASYYVPIESN
jgi:hypothetical protein